MTTQVPAIIPVDGLPQLSPTMQRHVDRTLAADRKGGEALWEKACAVADARNDAKHGEWGRYLEATGMEERTTRRLIDIAERGRRDSQFRDGVISGWLSWSVAAIVAKAEAELLAQLLEAPAQPTARIAQALVNPATLPDLPDPAPAAPLEDEKLAGLVRHWVRAENLPAARQYVPDIQDPALRAEMKALIASVAPEKFPPEWDAARDRAKAAGARLWYNESDGTYTLSERQGHVPRTSSWREILVRLDGLEAEAVEAAPAADDEAELDGLIADLQAVEARMEVGIADLDDRRALERIADRADVLGAINLGTRASGLLSALGTQPADEVRAVPSVYAGQDAREARGLARVPYPGVEPPPDWDAWRARALALGGELTQSISGTFGLALPGQPYRGGRPAREWPELCACIAAAEPAPSAEESPPPLTALALQPLMRRAAALGYNVLVRANNVELVARDRTRGETFDDEARLVARIAELEATAAATPVPAPIKVAPPPADDRATYTAAERALADELAAATPRLKRLLMVACSDGDCAQSDATDGLFDYLTDGLLAAESAMLVWALGTVAPTPAAADWPGSDHPDLDEMSTELLGAEFADDPPAAADVARWQDTLDAFAEELSDETYQRLAHRIGALRARTQGKAA